MIIKFCSCLVLSRLPNGPQQKQHNTQTQITKDSKHNTYETQRK